MPKFGGLKWFTVFHDFLCYDLGRLILCFIADHCSASDRHLRHIWNPLITHSKQWPCHVNLTSEMSHFLVLAVFIVSKVDATLPPSPAPAVPNTHSHSNAYSCHRSSLLEGEPDHVVLLPMPPQAPQTGPHTIDPAYFYLILPFHNLMLIHRCKF